MMQKNTQKILLLIIAVLLIANIVQVLFSWNDKGTGKRGSRGKEMEARVKAFLQDDLAFSKEQLTQYDTLQQRYQQKVSPLFDSLRSGKEEKWKTLCRNQFTDSIIRELSMASAGKQQFMESLLFLHFRNIRQLCNPSQQQRFDSLLYKVLNKRKAEK